MKLSCGIVGLPNVGKSTLFNALLQKQAALAANYPFATIEPNVGIVPVPDPRLPELQRVVRAARIVPATVEFVDIAGLVAGAASGAGLGNDFLAHIRTTSVIAHVVRVFPNGDIIREGSVDPASDLATVTTELQLADLQTLDKQRAPNPNQPPELHHRWQQVQRWRTVLNRGELLLPYLETDGDHVLARELGLLTAKPFLVVGNIAEDQLSQSAAWHERLATSLGLPSSKVILICAQLEAELAALTSAEKQEYMETVGVDIMGLERLIRQAYTTLGLQSFYTAGEKEARAWTIPAGALAPQAAAVIHTDFAKHFIRANVVNYVDFIAAGGWKGARERGQLRQEGRDYHLQPEDVVEFLIGT